MSIRANVVVFTAFLSAIALPLRAEQCAPRDTVAQHLGTKYSEAQTAAGLQTSTRIVEVWASEEGTWTILVTRADGMSCIVAAGTHWRETIPAERVAGIPG